MDIIKITKERMEQILPQNIKDSDVLSNDAKRVLAAIINYHFVLEKAKDNGHAYLSNDTLRESVEMKKENMLSAVQELIELNLVRRERGEKWTKGSRPKASKYYVIWDNLGKELKKPSFDDLYKAFLTPREAPKTEEGTIDIVSDSDIVFDIVKDKDIVKEKDLEIELDKGKEIDKGEDKEIVLENRKDIIKGDSECKSTSFLNDLDRYFNIKLKELKRRYYTLEDISILENNLYQYIEKYKGEEAVQAEEYVKNKICTVTGNMRADLLVFGDRVNDQNYTVAKAF